MATQSSQDNQPITIVAEMASRSSQDNQPITTVAYLLSITACKTRFGSRLHDPAMVLKRSIEDASFPYSRYKAEFYAIVPPSVAESRCATTLEKVGFNISIQDYPILPADILDHEETNSCLKKQIARDGCCGHAELLKLHAYSMVNHSIAVHLDLDTLVLSPMDELFDAMYFPPESERGKLARTHLVKDKIVAPTYNPVIPIQQMVFNAFFTKDYNMVPAGMESRVGVQGGFLIVRPNTTVRDELVAMVRSGQFWPGRSVNTSGWFRSGYGRHIWGSMSIQGLLAYYFDQIAKDSSVELHRCKYNQIADNPRRSTFGKYPRATPLNVSASWHDTGCRDGRADCDDVQCQNWPLEDTRLVHYTYCKAPWLCTAAYAQPLMTLRDETCRLMHARWFKVRRDVKGTEVADGFHFPNITASFCRGVGDYIAFQQSISIQTHQ